MTGVQTCALPIYAPEWLITKAARVCRDVGDKNEEQDKKSIRYLLKFKHMKPFDFPTITYRLVLPIYVERQIRVYRSMVALERSLRTLPPMEKSFEDKLQCPYKAALKSYEYLVENEYPKETARAILPLGTFTTVICQFTARGALHLFEERLTKAAQTETRLYARLMWRRFQEAFPFTAEAFKELNPDLLFEE